MTQDTAPTQVRKLLLDLQEQTRSLKETCRTCDCYQGLVTQLELDGGPAAAAMAAGLKVPADQMHGCLGCDPCPPGDAFSAYLRGMGPKVTVETCGNAGCNCTEGERNS